MHLRWRCWCVSPARKFINCDAVVAHVRVIDVGQQAKHAFLLADRVTTELQFEIFGTRPAEISVEVNAIRDFRASARFGEA